METEDKYVIAIEWAMGEFELTQAKAGKMMGVVQSAVSQMLGKSRSIKPKHIKGLAKGIDMTVNELLTKSLAGQHIEETITTQTNTENIVSLAEKHKELIDKFNQKILALQINELLLEIEKIGPQSLERAMYQLQIVKKHEEEEAAKKRDACNDKQ